jgi:hypothetical protein
MCCQAWIDRLRSDGFQVKVAEAEDMALVKDERRIPPLQGSCHTALIDGYVVEGHVPVSSIRRLLNERPKLVGLLLPGQPAGAPGLEEAGPPNFDVLALHPDGTTTVFEHVGSASPGDPPG